MPKRQIVSKISLVGALLSLSSAVSLFAVGNFGDLTLESSRDISNVWAVTYNDFDDTIYYIVRPSSSGSVFRLNADGTSTSLYSSDAPAGITDDPKDGDIFFTRDFPGIISRVPEGSSSSGTWVSNIPGGGDDDPAGILIVPDYYAGDLASPGDGFFTDRGFNGNERVLSFSPDTAQGEVLLLSFNRFDGLYGIFATNDKIVLVEHGNGLLELTESGGVYSATLIPTTSDISEIKAAVWDDQRKVAYLAISDFGTSSAGDETAEIAMWDPSDNSITTLVSGLEQLRWHSLAINDDYTRLYAAEYAQGKLLTYILPTTTQADLRESFYNSSFNAFFNMEQVFDENTRLFGGTLTVPANSGESVSIDFAASPSPTFVSSVMGTELNLGAGLDVSETQVSLLLTPQGRPLYNLTIFYEDFDIGQSFEFPGQFPDHFPGLSRSGNLLQTSSDDASGTFTFRELSADNALEILFNRNGSDVRITKIGFELIEPAYDGSPYAWEGNTGWINFDAATRSLAVKSGFSYLEGYAFSANTGWIYFGDGSPLNGFAYANDGNEHGVNISSGTLGGYAWSANTGWIFFGWASGSDPNRPQINQSTGELSGYAWSGNLGWINLNDVEIPSYFVPNSTDPVLVDFGSNFAENDLEDFREYDDGVRDFSGTIDAGVGQSDPLEFDINLTGSFEVSGTGEARVVDIGIGSPSESVFTFTSQNAKLYNLTFSFEGFDIGEEFVFGGLVPDEHTCLELNAGVLTTAVDDAAHSFTFYEFPANTQLVFTIRHDGSGIRLTEIDFDASESTVSDAPYAFSGNTGWVNLAPNTNTGIVVHDSFVSGYAYDANTGWIKLGQRLPDNGHTYTNTGSDHGINHDGGALYGYAWSGNVGWINFGWAGANDPNAAMVDLLTGDFSGYAWGANIGWINLGTGQLGTDEIRIDDVDLDGMADSWELDNFGDLTTAGVGTNSDGDSQTDAAEYIGGTDANDASSYLQIISTSYNGSVTEVTLEFTSDSNRIYSIEQATELDVADPWSDSGLGDVLGESGTTTRVFKFSGGDKRFFRVTTKLPLSE